MNNQSEKSWVATLLLCVFLGSFGAHRFYVGKIGTGIAMFLIMLLLGWLGIGLLICGIWSLIDLIMICIGSFKTKEGLDLKK